MCVNILFDSEAYDATLTFRVKRALATVDCFLNAPVTTYT